MAKVERKLPDSLLVIIGRYGNARSGGCDEAEIIYRWEELCSAIKKYAAEDGATDDNRPCLEGGHA